MLKVVFMGTPEISAQILKTLSEFPNIEIVGVVSQPDKAKDRKKQFVYSPVKKFCLEHNINLLQPDKVVQIYSKLQSMAPDIIITCAYGQFVPQKILDLPKIGCFNLHASLLPKLRGGAPINWSIINGDKKTGITLMKMVLQMDAGDIVSAKECNIDDNETAKSLTAKLTLIAQQLLRQNWDNLIANTYNSYPQDINNVTFGYNITKQDTIIDFNKSCHQIDCLIRGLYDKPIAIWNYCDLAIKVHSANLTSIKSTLHPGAITRIDKTGIYVATNDYDLQIIKLQLPNKAPLEVKQIINGHHCFKLGK